MAAPQPYGCAMATLGDVARHAGVSPASVSRVFNHPAKVSPEVRERIMRSVEALGYVPDGAARALASRHSRTIGNVVPTLGIGIFAAGVGAMQRRLEECGYQLLVAASDYDEAKEASQVRALIERGVEGIALVGHRHAPELYRLLRSRQLPYVNTYEFDGRNPHPCVGFDNRHGAFGLTRYLLELGHRAFGIITAPPTLNDRIAARLKGVLDCLHEHGIKVPPQHVAEVAQTIPAARQAMRALLTQHPDLTAICCTTDTLAIGVLFECRALGIPVPEHISVTGFSDLEIVAHLDPPLTTVHIPADRIGSTIADFLLDRIDGRAGPDKIELEAEIVIRQSTGPVRPAIPARRSRRTA
ncbi:transcriptional regulator, LacI family [Rhizobiales bacterium GAS191]|jgi:LacI family transcriptional regulator|nr:transcriptional regulator, LacI family [Rhizobiales bacterium GAS113]SEC54493.1 transcriptional regulator, LacI family [Rhizobiales bacterium GAS188]SEC73488.1 transcriptional regulator, LacI family [Rhizobiales bacterium GAS191]